MFVYKYCVRLKAKFYDTYCYIMENNAILSYVVITWIVYKSILPLHLCLLQPFLSLSSSSNWILHAVICLMYISSSFCCVYDKYPQGTTRFDDLLVTKIWSSLKSWRYIIGITNWFTHDICENNTIYVHIHFMVSL